MKNTLKLTDKNGARKTQNGCQHDNGSSQKETNNLLIKTDSKLFIKSIEYQIIISTVNIRQKQY